MPVRRSATIAGVILACAAAGPAQWSVAGPIVAAPGGEPVAASGARSAALPATVTFESAGFVGGSATGVATHGGLGVATVGRTVQVYDTSDPASLVLLGSSPPLPALAVVKAMDADRAYLVELRRNTDEPDADVLHVVVLGGGAAPELQGSLEFAKGTLVGVTAADGWVFGAGGLGVVVVDARGVAPVVAATLATAEPSRSVAVRGALAAVGTDVGISLLDITDPSRPIPGRAVELGAPVYSLAFVGTDLLAGTANHGRPTLNGIVSVDLSDPVRPWVAGAIEGPETPEQIVVQGERAWVLAAASHVRDADRLMMLDLAEWPVVVVAAWSGGLWSGGIAVLGDGVWSAAASAGLRRFVADQDETVVMGTDAPVLGYPSGMATAGEALLVADADGELYSLGMEDPGRLLVRASEVEITYPSLGERVLQAGPMVVDGNRAYVTWLPWGGRLPFPGGVLAVDVTDPAHPRALGAWDPTVTPLPGPGWQGITNRYPPVVREGRLYLSGGPSVLELDVTGATPAYRSDLDVLCDPHCSPGGLALRQDSAWVALSQPGLAEVLLDDPSGELVLGKQIATTYPANDVATLASGDLLVATRFDLTVLDPDSGITRATIDDFTTEQVDVVGERAYAIENRAGRGDSRWYFTVIDVANALAPRVLGSYEMGPFGPHPYAVHGEWLYLGAGQSGIEMVRMVAGRDPADSTVYLPSLRTLAPSRLATELSGSTAAAD